MASALLASSRNEPFWGQQKVYMRKNPNPNPNPRPVPDNPATDRPRPTSASSPFVDRIDHAAGADDPPPAAYAAAAPAVSEDSSSFNHRRPPALPGGRQHYLQRPPSRKESSFGGPCVAINIAAYSRRELLELKRRLISELEQVRGVSSRIESGDLQIARSTCFSASSYGGGSCGGGREVTSAASARPAPLLLNQPMALDSQPLLAAPDRRTPTGGSHYVHPPEPVPAGAPHHPGDNHKKVSKRSLPLTSPREVKRQATSPGPGGMSVCGQILKKLLKQKNAWVFNKPVDVVGLRLHDYHQIIKRPMDLGTVKSQLERNMYSSPKEFAADIRLTFNNALVYNPEGHSVNKMANQFLNLFEKLFADHSCRPHGKEKRAAAPHARGSGEEEKKRKSSSSRHPPPQVPVPPEAPGRLSSPAPAKLLPASSSVAAVPTPEVPVRSPSPVPPAAAAAVQPVAPQPRVPPPPVLMSRAAMGKQPKPKAKEPNKREMSFEEKSKLSMGLQSLPQDKMGQVLQIVRRRNPDPSLQGDEIELDFEVLDTETLWELDRFVCNCKKMMSKMKRQVAMLPAGPAAAETKVDIVEKTNVAAAGMETSEPAQEKKGKKGGEGGEEDVDIGEDMPSSHFPPVEIEKDTGYHSESSSSSSSSSDSSSSSGSDSRSSSESESDADEAQSPGVG